MCSIARQDLVKRHSITVNRLDFDSLLQVGNGEFAFSADITGLQSFAGNTMAQWGWHSFPVPSGLHPEDLKLQYYNTSAGSIGYPTSSIGQDDLYKWRRENPHRLNLGRFRFLLNGLPLKEDCISDIKQSLDMWNGLLKSSFLLNGQIVKVETSCHPELDLIGVSIQSEIAGLDSLSVELAFPYGDPGISGADWEKSEAHVSSMRFMSGSQVDFSRHLDGDVYFCSLKWQGSARFCEHGKHTFTLTPEPGFSSFKLTSHFSSHSISPNGIGFDEVKSAAETYWNKFWMTGGAIDLSGSSDPRWYELERRIVLSQYLLAVNEAGSLPPQESGLYNNSGWYGKFHLEMHWWHSAHYALWHRWELFERSLGWYMRSLPSAVNTAAQQGFRGARWHKMTGPDAMESPSSIGPLLIWQQAHPIFYAELDYQLHQNKESLEKWKEIIWNTADFMASFAKYDDKSRYYILDSPLKTMPENNDSLQTKNPVFELSYWRFGLRIALEWSRRLGIEAPREWTIVFNKLAPLPVENGVYILQEALSETYEKWNFEHPALIGIYGILPGDGVDAVIMRETVQKVFKSWQWDKCWGWDFPMMAMAAARNGLPELAIDALLHPSVKNGFNHLGLSNGGPFPYFPSNGGFLYAVAMMAAGWANGPEVNAPGFPSGASWVVKWENLEKSL